MRRLFTVLLCVAGVAAAGGHASAQASRPERTIIAEDILAELQRAVRHALDEDALREVARELGRALRSLSGEFEHLRLFGSDLDLSAVVRGAWIPDQGRDLRQQQTDRQTRTLAIGANGVLELRNVTGNITVKAGGGREATIEITRVSRARTAADATRGLEHVTVDVVTRGDRGSVTTRYADERRPPYSVSVSYQVTAPAGARIIAHSISGDVSISGVKGEIAAHTVSGNVDISDAGDISVARTVSGDITIRNASSERAMDVGTMNGAVRLDGVSARRLSASAVSGTIRIRDAKIAIVDATCMSGDIEYSGAVASNGRYEFKNHAGDIRLALAGDFDLEARTFSGAITTDPGLKLPPATGRTRSLRGSVGKGDALVEVTTFTGEIWVGRTLK